YVQERIADAACELYASSCTLSRLDHLLTNANGNPDELNREVTAGGDFLQISDRRVRQWLTALGDNEDEMTTTGADAAVDQVPIYSISPPCWHGANSAPCQHGG